MKSYRNKAGGRPCGRGEDRWSAWARAGVGEIKSLVGSKCCRRRGEAALAGAVSRLTECRSCQQESSRCLFSTSTCRFMKAWPLFATLPHIFARISEPDAISRD
jgi:hypothetical protein